MGARGIWKFFVLALLVTGCGKPAELSPMWEELKPSCMAVLPVQNQSVDEEAPQIIRRLLEEKLPGKGYRVPPREFVDRILLENFDIHAEEGGQVMAADPVELGRELECDGLFYATVTQWDKKTLHVYNEINVFGNYEVLSGRDGGILWTLVDDGVKDFMVNDPRNLDSAEAAAATGVFLLMGYEPYAVRAVEQALRKLPDR